MPWWHTGGAAWPWIGAALAKPERLITGTGVTAPILRYHPAVIAQVFATLGYMFQKTPDEEKEFLDLKPIPCM